MPDLLPIAAVLDGVGRAARSVDRAIKNYQASSAHGPIADPQGATAAYNADIGANSSVEYGFIADAIPGIRQYRVMPENGGALLACTCIMHGVGSVTGVYDATTLISGTHVRFMRHSHTPLEGVIIGVEPSYHVDQRLMYADVVSQGSNTGIHVETGYHTLLKMGGATGAITHNGGLVNYGGRSPWDSLEIGELNYSTETGTMIHMDPYMAFLRADELTGIWCFYWDGLTRIGGQHLQEITSVSTREIYDDEGESSLYRGVAGYPWENRGMLLNPNSTNTTETIEAETTQTTKPYYARLEPQHDDQQAFHRFQTYEGYLGQAEKKIVTAPNRDSGYSTSVYRYSDKTYQPTGLLDAQATMAGHYFVRSALGITIAKRPIIPVPKRVKIVTDQANNDPGDMHGKYKASSLYTDGASALRDHKVQPTPTLAAVGAGESMLHSATAVLDMHAHMFNWEGLHPFYYHEKDYYIPEERTYMKIVDNQEIPDWSKLNSSSQWYLSPSTPTAVQIDHRTGATAQIYRNTSYVTLLDDGGVLIGGGMGEEIRMAGGSIFLSCPGDVFTEAGRNIIGWAGRDHISRAWNSVDITANGGGTSGGDVRLKAERNMQLLSANSGGMYGTFIENRSVGSSDSYKPQYDFRVQGEGVRHTGIILKAADAEICTYGASLYFRSCPPHSDAQDEGYAPNSTIPKKGDITFDATDGTSTSCCGDITTRSNNIKHWVCCEIMHSFNVAGTHGTSQGVNLFTQYGETFCNDAAVNGSVVAWKDVVAGQNVISAGGEVYSVKGVPMKLTDAAKTSVTTATGNVNTYETSLKTWANGQHTTDFDTMWYASGRPGNNATIKSMWTSLRVDDDYYCSSFTLYETRWAQMSRSAGASPYKTWTETSVSSNKPGATTYPFPGSARLYTSTSAYKKHSFKLYDETKQWAQDRATTSTSSVYEASVTLNAPTYSRIDGNYPIIGK